MTLDGVDSSPEGRLLLILSLLLLLRLPLFAAGVRVWVLCHHVDFLLLVRFNPTLRQLSVFADQPVGLHRSFTLHEKGSISVIKAGILRKG